MLADPPLPEDVPDVVPLLTTREVSCCQVEVSPAQVLQSLSDPPALDSDAVARGYPAHDLLGSVDFAPGEKQVWSLTQLNSVDFSQSRISTKNPFSTNAQTKFASVVIGGVLGPPRLARHT